MANMVAGNNIKPETYYRAYIMVAKLGDGTEVKATIDTMNSANHGLRLNQATSNLLGSLIQAGYDVVDYKMYAIERS
jgi:hypothetical protein